jgi:hypothetical protein
MKTNKHIKKIYLLLFIGFITSCQDGDKGKSYFQLIDSGNGATVNSVSDPNVSNGTWNTYYLTKAGTYHINYEYGTYNYDENYTLIQNAGVVWNGIDNGFLNKAPNGKDLHYTFDCAAAQGSELSYRNSSYPDIIIDKTIYIDGGKIVIKGKAVYDPNHVLARKHK